MKKSQRGYEGPGCPRCWTPIAPDMVKLQQGTVYCGECALSFTAVVFEPKAAPALVQRALDGAEGQAQCARHQRNAAVSSCEHCGAFMCALCRIESDGKVICAACFERLRAEGALASATTKFRSWGMLGLHLTLLSVLLSPAAIVTGPAAIICILRGIKQDRKDGELGVPVLPILSMLASVLCMLVSVFIIVAAAGGIMRKH